MSVLALDLGTKTGWCLHPNHFRGTWDLKPGRFEGGGMRFVRFHKMLDAFAPATTQVVFEEVRAHKGVDAAHIYGGLMATLQAWCEDAAIPYTGVPVGTIKRYWTGKGNAGKPEMLLAARQKGFTITDDNECDALALWYYFRDHGDKA